MLGTFERQSRYNLEICQKRFHRETTSPPTTRMLMIFDKHTIKFIRKAHWKPAKWRTIVDGFAICQPLQAAPTKNLRDEHSLGSWKKLPIYMQDHFINPHLIWRCISSWKYINWKLTWSLINYCFFSMNGCLRLIAFDSAASSNAMYMIKKY